MLDRETSSLQGAGRSDKKALVLSEAISLFNDQGYHDTRLEDVAQNLGTTKTSISYHFKNKEALLFEAYSATCDMADAQLAKAEAEATGLGRIVAVLRGFAEAHSSSVLGRQQPLAIISDPAALNSEGQEAVSCRLQNYAQTIARHLDAGREDGSVHVRSLEATTFFLLSLQQWTRQWLISLPPSEHRRAISGLLGFIEIGLSSSRRLIYPGALPNQATDIGNFIFDREARNKMKQDAFLRAGTRHFNVRGYRSLSVNELTSDLGVSRGTFYYHFEDKDALLKGCAARSLDTIEKAIDYAQHSSVPSPEALHTALSSLFEGHLSDLNPLLRQTLFASLPARERPLVLSRSSRAVAGFAELIARGIADETIRPLDFSGIEHLIFGTVVGATRERLTTFRLKGPDGPVSAASISAANYYEVLMKGLVAD